MSNSLLDSSRYKKIIFVFPLIVIFLIVLNKIIFGINDQFYQEITVEDGPVEYLTTFAYFGSFIFSIAISRYFKEKKLFLILFLVLGIGFLLIALEEISYGQRIFDFESPEWFPTNVQGETNIHNLGTVQKHRPLAYLFVSFLGSFGWFIFPKIFNKFSKNSQNYSRIFLKYAVPPKYLISYFLPIFLLKIIYEYAPREFVRGPIRWNFFVWYDSEPMEMLLSLGIFLFVINSYFKIRSDFSKKNQTD